MNAATPSDDTDNPTIPASTVLLLRDGDDGPEVFMVVRHHEIDSFSGALVFPGGKVDPGDGEARQYCVGAEGMEDTALTFRVAAIREAFEECGVLLAYDSGGDFLRAERLAELETAWRDRLQGDEATIGELCAAENLRLAIDHLRRAKKGRELYDGLWLPEPWVDGGNDSPVEEDLAESLSTAFMIMSAEEIAALCAANEGTRAIVIPTDGPPRFEP